MSNKTLGMEDSLYHYYFNMTVTETQAQIALRKRIEAREENRQVAPEQAQLIAFLIRLLGVKTIIEIGTFTGYNTLSMAQALPKTGKVICCDTSKEWASIRQEYWKQAGVENKIELHIAPALETLDRFILTRQYANVDLVFIDADKKNYLRYIENALQLLRRGGVILIDNVFLKGKVAENQYEDEETETLRQVNQDLANNPRVFYSILPIADGLGIALKK